MTSSYAEAMPKKGDLDTCLHCGRRITYGRYYFRKGKAVKKWTHPEGTTKCLTKPTEWRGEWPTATPVTGP